MCDWVRVEGCRPEEGRETRQEQKEGNCAKDGPMKTRQGSRVEKPAGGHRERAGGTVGKSPPK